MGLKGSSENGAGGGTGASDTGGAAGAGAFSPGNGMRMLSSGFSKRAYCPLKVRRTSPTEPFRCLAMMMMALPRRSSPFSLL